MQVILGSWEYKTSRLPETSDCYAEGGEFYYCPNEGVLFSVV